MAKEQKWENLNPSRLVEVTLCANRKTNNLCKVYRLSAYTISPDINIIRNARDSFFGILIRSYGLRMATTLNSSYEVIGNKPTDYDTLFNNIEYKINTLVKKKIKKGYEDVTSDVSFNIPAIHRLHSGLEVNKITESFVMNNAAHEDYRNLNVGKYVNIL